MITRGSRLKTVLGIVSLTILGVFIALPLFLVVLRAITGFNGEPGALGTILDPENIQVIANTVYLGVLVIIVATLFAAPLAFLMARTTMRNHRWLDIAVLIPFMTPPYIAAMAWDDFTRKNGLAERYLGDLGLLLQDIFASPVGMAIVMGADLFPFLYLLLRNNFESLSRSLDEAASVHGAGPWLRLRKVITPLILGTYSMGALLVFVRAAGEFGTPVTLGNKIGFPLLVSQIHQDITIDPLDFPNAAALSTILLTLGITAWGLQQWFTLRSNNTTASVRAVRSQQAKLGWWAIPAWLWVAFVMTISVLVPYFVIITSALAKLRSKPPGFDNMTLDHFSTVLNPGSSGLTALGNSVWAALIAATVTTILAVVLTLIVARSKGPITQGNELLAVAPDTVPTIVLALGMIFLWNSPLLPVTFYNTPLMIIIAYSIVFLPAAFQSVKAVRLQINDGLMQAGTVAGASQTRVFSRILLPLLFPGLVSAWALSFVVGVRELVVSSLVRPPQMQLLSPWILSQFDAGLRGEAMAMALIGVGGTTVAMILLEVWRRRMASRYQ